MRKDDISQIDWDTLPNGVYDIHEIQFQEQYNQPPAGTYNWGVLVALNNGGNVQIFYPHTSDPIIIRAAYGNGTWKNWRKLATAEPTQEFNLPLVAGFTTVSSATHDNVYGKDQFGRCIVTGFISGTFGINTVIAILPVGFRPLKEIHAPCYFSGIDESTPTVGRISINPDGQIFCFVQGAANNNALFNFNFIVS